VLLKKMERGSHEEAVVCSIFGPDERKIERDPPLSTTRSRLKEVDTGMGAKKTRGGTASAYASRESRGMLDEEPLGPK